MHYNRMLVVFLPGKAPQDDCPSFVISVLVGNRSFVRSDREWMRGMIFHLELFLDGSALELHGSPLHHELSFRNQLLFADSQHFVPAEAGNSRLGMSPFIHPASACLDKKVSA